VIVLHAGSGAGDFEVAGKAAEDRDGVLQRRVGEVLKKRGLTRAAHLLGAYPFEIFRAVNHFNDDFCVLMASAVLDGYENARVAAESKADRLAFRVIAEVFCELGVCLRFIAVELDTNMIDPQNAGGENTPFGNSEALLNTLARLFAYEGATATVAILSDARASIEQTDYDNWNGGTNFFTLFLYVPVALFAQTMARKSDIEGSVLDKSKLMLEQTSGNNVLAGVRITPERTTDTEWREKAKAWLAGKGVTNQGRVRSDNIASRSCDGLLFRSQPEILLYQALKCVGVSFAPLPVFVRGGDQYRRIEPDFVVLKDGVFFVIEVDGDTVHQETPEEAHSRRTMLLHEGAFVERIKARECDTVEKAAASAKRLLEVFAKRKSAK
jgi:hypothetical protein